MNRGPSSAATWGALSWLSAAQFFVTQLIVAQAVTTPFSLRYNHISDLGNTDCNPMPANLLPSRTNAYIYICSPLHNVMNASFVLLGIGLLLGAVLTGSAFAPSRLRVIGLTLIGLAGFCLILVGFAPENVNLAVHGAAAVVQFIGGNVGIIVMGVLLYQHHHAEWGRFSIGLGCLGLLGIVVLIVARISNLDLGLGIGGWEAVVVYPLPLWAMITGLLMLINRQQTISTEQFAR